MIKSRCGALLATRRAVAMIIAVWAGTTQAQPSTEVHTAEMAAANADTVLGRRMAAGEQVYATACLACHQADGKGLPGAFPPLRVG